MGENGWRRCSNCKTDIAFAAVYWVCSVSTCNRKRTGLVFCSTECWDAHLPLMRHREAWAVEETAPAGPVASSDPAPGAGSAAAKPAPTRPPAVRRVLVRPPSEPPASSSAAPHEILIVASRLKAYIRARSGMNTSDSVLDVLSDRVRVLCDRAIEQARKAERKTVLDRDF